MTRLYIQPSFLNSCEEHGLWSGGNDQYRGDHSVDVATFDRNGRARIEAFSDQSIDSLKKRKTSIPLSDRILPQKKRLNTLRDQLIELETEYKTTQMSIEEYSTLRDILMVKISRAKVLYKKAISVRPSAHENNDESEEFGVEYITQNSVTEDTCGVAWVDELSSKNTFKKMLQNTCKGFKLAVHCKHRTAIYIQSLKDL